ncbi:MAG: response regulator transcription factor [Oceanobacter sp.]
MKRILIIDDASTIRMYNRSILEQGGYLVEEAVNGMEGLEKALETHYDLYIVDINMPKLDGYGFLQQLRAESIDQAPAMMVSTEAAGQDKETAYRSGANLYLVKPTKPDELIAYARLLMGEPCQ